jgi:hypothetical protein
VTSPIAHSPVSCLVNSVGKPVDVKEWIRDVWLKVPGKFQCKIINYAPNTLTSEKHNFMT